MKTFIFIVLIYTNTSVLRALIVYNASIFSKATNHLFFAELFSVNLELYIIECPYVIYYN